MSSHRHTHGTTGHTRRPATNASRRGESGPDGGAGALDENVEAIKRWEQALLHERSRGGAPERPDHR